MGGPRRGRNEDEGSLRPRVDPRAVGIRRVASHRARRPAELALGWLDRRSDVVQRAGRHLGEQLLECVEIRGTSLRRSVAADHSRPSPPSVMRTTLSLPALRCGAIAQRASTPTPSPAPTSSTIASVSSTRDTWRGFNPGGIEHAIEDRELRARGVIEKEVLGGDIGGVDVAPFLPWVARRDHGHQLVAEERPHTDAPVAHGIAHDREVEPALEHGGDRAPGGRGQNARLDAGERIAVTAEDGGKPVVAGIALGAHAQHGLHLTADVAHLLDDAGDRGEDVPRAVAQALAPLESGSSACRLGRTGSSPAALEIGQLAAQRRLGQKRTVPARVRLPCSATASTSFMSLTSSIIPEMHGFRADNSFG